MKFESVAMLSPHHLKIGSWERRAAPILDTVSYSCVFAVYLMR